eukprot:363324-Chlamydomonas_euryale.AAC.11
MHLPHCRPQEIEDLKRRLGASGSGGGVNGGGSGGGANVPEEVAHLRAQMLRSEQVCAALLAHSRHLCGTQIWVKSWLAVDWYSPPAAAATEVTTVVSPRRSSTIHHFLYGLMWCAAQTCSFKMLCVNVVSGFAGGGGGGERGGMAWYDVVWYDVVWYGMV